MGDKTRGLYNKFEVRRVDGSSELGGKHCGCDYFVLDLTHDKHAPAALLAYAHSCEAEYPLLAADLREKALLPTSGLPEPCELCGGMGTYHKTINGKLRLMACPSCMPWG